MLFTEANLKFKFLHLPNLIPKTDDYLFCYYNNRIGLTTANKIPTVSDFIKDFAQLQLYCFGTIGQHRCFLLEQKEIQPQFNFIEIRSSCGLLNTDFQHAAVLGHYINRWRNLNNYCGRCGKLMQDSVNERARICPSCNNTSYPRISPCIIVLVTKGDKMLLARSPHFPPGIFSTLAGFIDPGETVENAVKREVKEEVGIEISDIKYICSQPWPFPDSLMLGFTANYDSGEISINKNEIELAGWFDQNNLPTLPSEMSISRFLIDQHLQLL